MEGVGLHRVGISGFLVLNRGRISNPNMGQVPPTPLQPGEKSMSHN